MLIFVVFLVSVNILMVKTENDVVRVILQEQGCTVQHKVLTVGTKFILEIISDYFITESKWIPHNKQRYLEDLVNYNISVIFYKGKHTAQSKPNITIKYKYLHTRQVNKSLEGKWTFKFKYLKNYNPWSHNNENASNSVCYTFVEVKDTHSIQVNEKEASGTARSLTGAGELKPWVVIVLSLFGIFMLVQSTYIIYGKVRSCKAKRNNDEEPRRNIADRPPLPLPPDEVIQMPPQSPISPGHKHHFPSAPPMPVENSYNSHPVVSQHSYRNKGLNTSDEGVITPGFGRRQQGPLVPKHSFTNKALDTSIEELTTPGLPRRHMDGPLEPKHSYRNKALDTSVEELRTPDFPRSYMEAKFSQLAPKAVAPSQSFKLPKPLPRSPPSPALERVPAFNPAHRPEPVPPLHPKKEPVFPPPAPFKIQDPSRSSDDEWQYEQLQPASKYLNNLPTANNYNNMY